MATLNKVLYLIAVLSYIIGIFFLLEKDSPYIAYYLMIFPLCGIMMLLFGLIVDNVKVDESNLFRFFYLLNSVLFAFIMFMNEVFLISSILIIVSSITAVLTKNTDKYWATKSDHS